MEHRCPDCGVSMESVEFGMADAWQPHVKTEEKREGVLGKLGMSERKDVETVACTECGLIRFYADIETEEAY